MDNISHAEYEWARVRMGAYQEEYLVMLSLKRKAEARDARSTQWLKVSIVLNIILIGFFVFVYFKTH